MQNIDENIDLDALFDSLSIGETGSSKVVDTTKLATATHPGLVIAEAQEISSLDGNLFLFDTPPDQS